MVTLSDQNLNYQNLAGTRAGRAAAIAKAGGIESALGQGQLPQQIDLTLSEALVLGLLRQGVRKFIVVFGHGSTEIGEVLRVYQEAGLLETYGVRNEIEAAHAATALRWVTGQKAAVVTSIGPGALQALAGSLAAASDRLGVWFLLGDETTEDEGPNMQQIPRHEQQLFLRLYQSMGESYCLHTPQSVGAALRRGLNAVDHPHQASPFYLLMPMNTQAAPLANFNLDELPTGSPPPLGQAIDDGRYEAAANLLLKSQRVTVKVGGGARQAGTELQGFLDLVDGVAVTSPLVSGVIPYDHPRNMTVGGSKGSISGNHAMEHADLLVSVGSRSVCQSDSSRTGYPQVKHVININTDMQSAMHYNRTLAFVGDAAATLKHLNEVLRGNPKKHSGDSSWFRDCQDKRKQWDTFKSERYDNATLFDDVWQKEVLTQPAAIKCAADWARTHKDVVNFFDAGDVQANGFQVVEDDRLGRTFTETGASYMGFAVSALLAGGLAEPRFHGLAFTGDGSFTMNPQILIDGVQHGVKGTILLLDNRRMGAITGLQDAQYSREHATHDAVAVDYLVWAGAVQGVLARHGGYSAESLLEALDASYGYDGLSMVYVPVYFGPDPLGGLGAYGRWNVGNWCEDVQALRHEIGL